MAYDNGLMCTVRRQYYFCSMYKVCKIHILYDFRQQVQQQAALVVQENEVLLEKLDQQDEMIDKTHEEYHCKS